MRRHGLRKKKLYGVWGMMKQRCFNPANKDYSNYGARGITVCEEWLNIENFYFWSINNGYRDSVSLDRIDFNGNYEPDNCRWVSNKIQQNNKRNTIKVIYKDKIMTLTELSMITDISREVLEMRYIRGDRGERLVREVRKRAV